MSVYLRRRCSIHFHQADLVWSVCYSGLLQLIIVFYNFIHHPLLGLRPPRSLSPLLSCRPTFTALPPPSSPLCSSSSCPHTAECAARVHIRNLAADYVIRNAYGYLDTTHILRLCLWTRPRQPTHMSFQSSRPCPAPPCPIIYLVRHLSFTSKHYLLRRVVAQTLKFTCALIGGLDSTRAVYVREKSMGGTDMMDTNRAWHKHVKVPRT